MISVHRVTVQVETTPEVNRLSGQDHAEVVRNLLLHIPRNNHSSFSEKSNIPHIKQTLILHE